MKISIEKIELKVTNAVVTYKDGKTMKVDEIAIPVNNIVSESEKDIPFEDLISETLNVATGHLFSSTQSNDDAIPAPDPIDYNPHPIIDIPEMTLNFSTQTGHDLSYPNIDAYRETRRDTIDFHAGGLKVYTPQKITTTDLLKLFNSGETRTEIGATVKIRDFQSWKKEYDKRVPLKQTNTPTDFQDAIDLPTTRLNVYWGDPSKTEPNETISFHQILPVHSSTQLYKTNAANMHSPFFSLDNWKVIFNKGGIEYAGKHYQIENWPEWKDKYDLMQNQ